MNIKLEKGKPIIIRGRQWAGKTKLAHEIARNHGTYAEISFCDFYDRFYLSAILNAEPDTLIVDDFITNEQNISDMQRIIAIPQMEIFLKNEKSKNVKTPNFIFVTNSIEQIPIFTNGCQFMVIEI